METITGTIHDGQVVLDKPTTLPEGCRVVVAPVEAGTPGIRDDDWPTTPEGIAELLARMDQVEPLDLTPQEEADLAEWRAKMKTHTTANQNNGIDELFP